MRAPAEIRAELKIAARQACRDEAFDLEREQDALRLRREVERVNRGVESARPKAESQETER